MAGEEGQLYLFLTLCTDTGIEKLEPGFESSHGKGLFLFSCEHGSESDRRVYFLACMG